MRRGGRDLAIPILSHNFNEEHACVLRVIWTFSLRKHTGDSFEVFFKKKRQIVLCLIICNTIVICNKICITFISLSNPRAYLVQYCWWLHGSWEDFIKEVTSVSNDSLKLCFTFFACQGKKWAGVPLNCCYPIYASLAGTYQWSEDPVIWFSLSLQ